MNQALIAYFTALVGPEEAEQFFSTFKDFKTRRSLRVNTLKTSVAFMQKWLKSQGYTVEVTPESPDGLDLQGSGEPLALKLPYSAGYTYPQDAASMFAVEMLDPQPGEMCLDLTAAPGGKSTHIAQKMQNTGVLFSNDMDTKRIQALRSNLERLGVWNTAVIRARAHDLSLWYPEVFDRVLIDPSCSGEGLFCTSAGQPELWSEKGMARFAQDQYSLLVSAFRLLKPGGRLVYSTCTLNAVEDDAVVDRLLADYPEADVLPMDQAGTPPQVAGLKGVRFWPQHTRTKGFFCIAIGKKTSLELEQKNARPFERLKAAKGKVLAELERLLKDFKLKPEDVWPNCAFVELDETLYAVSSSLLRVELPLRFKLTQPVLERLDSFPKFTDVASLAISQKTEEVVQMDAAQCTELFTQKALSLDLPENNAWAAVQASGFPMGIVKNKQGKGLFKAIHWI